MAKKQIINKTNLTLNYKKMKTTNHYILTIKDSINEFMEIGQIYCDMNTTKQAKKYFKKHNWVKKYLGNKRYQITFKQNSHLLQDSE